MKTTPAAPTRTTNLFITYECRRCRMRDVRLPQLHIATPDVVLNAVSTGHERRSFDCHMKQQLRDVYITENGKTMKADVYLILAGAQP